MILKKLLIFSRVQISVDSYSNGFFGNRVATSFYWNYATTKFFYVYAHDRGTDSHSKSNAKKEKVRVSQFLGLARILLEATY